MISCEPESGSKDTRRAQGRTPGPPLSQEVVAMIAHELRSPLAVMSNVLSVCRASIVPGAMPAAGDVLSRQVNRALRLVNELMDLTRFGEERLPFDQSPIDLRRVVLNAVQDREQQTRARRQALVLRLCAGPLWVRGDATRLEQIVGNLLENSSKYSPDGGRIVLTLSHTEDHAELVVHDDGVGISPADLPHIFDPYFRGGNAGQDSQGGLGLGLTLTRRLVHLHDGAIEAKSAGAGCGSEFTVTLPAAAAPGSAGAAS